MPNQHKAFTRGSLNIKEDWKKFVAQLNWNILSLFSISGSIYICLPLFLSVPLCLTFLCSVNCTLFPNATVNGINGKLNLAHIVLACTVCFTAQGMILDVQISAHIPAKMSYISSRRRGLINLYQSFKCSLMHKWNAGYLLNLFFFIYFLSHPQYAPVPLLLTWTLFELFLCVAYPPLL